MLFLIARQMGLVKLVACKAFLKKWFPEYFGIGTKLEIRVYMYFWLQE